jgi:hypothetical protein
MLTPANVEPEKRLVAAILTDALTILDRAARDARYRCRRSTREVVDWVVVDDRDSPFSFVNVCTVLGRDADVIRCVLAPSIQAVLTCAPGIVSSRRRLRGTGQ